MLWLPESRKTRSGRIFAEFHQAPTFSILTLLTESDDQQDTEPDDCEPYLDTSDSETCSDATSATDEEDTGPTPPSPPPPPKTKKRKRRPRATPVVIVGLEAPVAPISRAHRRRKGNREAAVSSSGHVARPAAYLKHAVGAKSLPTTLVPDALPVQWGAYRAGMPTVLENFRAKKRWTLSQLISIGFTRIQWDGIQARPLLDANGCIFAVLAGRPDTPAYAAAIARTFDLLVRAAAARAAAGSAPLSHRRGLFAVVTIGISYGQGQKMPSALRSDYPQLGQQLAADPAFQDIAAFGSAMLAFWAPSLYQYYRSCNSRPDPRLTTPRPFAHSVFASATFNLGPHAWTFKHRDILNLPFGWCPVTAFGDFDPTRGGHMILWDLKLVIEFPPGSTILIPSATLAHSNIPVAKTEHRAVQCGRPLPLCRQRLHD
ncbi:hypothetical protein B0H16DRAFT_1711298 [Mycena metata]|uniref:Uncharacterized protein n=1 Tax=Mycena metata TaxID=1033252 RepID=A0AAD7K646_9AGAR|nr:hypothetical protein B0H16DRAFT_1711298 [Mycena metata]